MRIAVLTTVHMPLDGRIFYKQIVSLREEGHRVTIFAPYQEGAEAIITSNGVSYVPLRLNGRRVARPLQWLRLLSLLRQGLYDVWHFHDPEILPLAVVWQKLFAPDVRLIYDVHEDVPKQILHKAWIPGYLRRPISVAIDQLERWGIRRCDLAIAATDSIGRRLVTATPHVIVVRNYPLAQLTGDVTTRTENSAHTRVIYCGGLTAIRGIREIVEAMTYLKDFPVELLLLGSFYPDSFGRMIHQNAGRNVTIVKPVLFTDVPDYLQASDIGIVCLHPAANHVESLPVKLFEYMQARLPVIASDFPLWRDILEQAGCGIVVDPLDPRQIADAIRGLVEEPAKRKRMGEAGFRAIQEKYSWQSQSRILLEGYQLIEAGIHSESEASHIS
jgi:glycosyltransferase involved in cell wall biosynthesis